MDGWRWAWIELNWLHQTVPRNGRHSVKALRCGTVWRKLDLTVDSVFMVQFLEEDKMSVVQMRLVFPPYCAMRHNHSSRLSILGYSLLEYVASNWPTESYSSFKQSCNTIEWNCREQMMRIVILIHRIHLYSSLSFIRCRSFVRDCTSLTDSDRTKECVKNMHRVSPQSYNFR